MKHIEMVGFNIQNILEDTPQSWIGRNKAEFATMFMFGFDYQNKPYAVYSAFDCASDTMALIVCDYDTDTILKTIGE